MTTPKETTIAMSEKKQIKEEITQVRTSIRTTKKAQKSTITAAQRILREIAAEHRQALRQAIAETRTIAKQARNELTSNHKLLKELTDRELILIGRLNK